MTSSIIFTRTIYNTDLDEWAPAEETHNIEGKSLIKERQKNILKPTAWGKVHLYD